jgi:ribose 1,5-bisphosphate isomerase
MDADRIIKDIGDMKVQGAKNVALAGLRALVICGDEIGTNDRKKFIAALDKKAAAIASARPTEPALRNAIDFVMRRLKKLKGKDMKTELRREAREFSGNIEDTIDRIGVVGARIIPDNAVVFTHCHSNTVMSIFSHAKKLGKKFSVICTETRPRNQGLTTAKQLSEMKIPVMLVVDSAARTFMKRCSMVIIGADAITSTGNVVNKIGSATIALIAEEQKKPMFVAAGTHKIDAMTAKGFSEPIEERPASEIADPKKLKGVVIKNPAFDVVSSQRISGIITENGVMPPQSIYGLIGKG